jgi:hypothetical protein
MNALGTVLPNASVMLNKLVTTDAASAMLSRKAGLVRLFKNYPKQFKISTYSQYNLLRTPRGHIFQARKCYENDSKNGLFHALECLDPSLVQQFLGMDLEDNIAFLCTVL